MLVLSRKPGEAIEIGEGAGKAVIKINEVKGDRVYLAIDAPKNTPVNRTEVARRIRDGEPPKS